MQHSAIQLVASIYIHEPLGPQHRLPAKPGNSNKKWVSEGSNEWVQIHQS